MIALRRVRWGALFEVVCTAFARHLPMRSQVREGGLKVLRVLAPLRADLQAWLLLLFLLFPLLCGAQLQPPASQDPLMQLMLAQPKIDVDSPVTPVVSFEPRVVKPGEPCTYRVIINALETAIEWPDNIQVPQGLNCRAGARGQILSMVGPLLVPRTTFNYRLQASAPGIFTIPEFQVKVNGKSVTIPAGEFVVSANPVAGLAPAQVLIFDLPTNGLFVGQTVRARVLLPGSPGGMIQSLGQVQINGQGFIVDQSSAHARIEAIPIGPGERPVNSFVYELLLTPIATGKIVISAQAYAVGNRVVGGVIIPGPGPVPNAPQYTLLDSDPMTLNIRPLPPHDQTPGFTGAVGSFSVDPPELSTNAVEAGQPLKLKVRVRGEGNLSRLVPPPPPRARDWQIFPGSAENTAPQIVQAQGSITFDYTLIPLSDKVRSTPTLPFSAFDPDRGTYDDLTVPSVAVSVLPGNVSAADLQAVIQAQALDREPEKEPVLSGLAPGPGLGGSLFPVQMRPWFPLLHLLPAGALSGLWLWDRRRRFLEQNPMVVVRRRALRALRRERRLLEKAARARDNAGFAAVAVNAMKVAVAPHYPAEPRALVGADVMTVLPESERSGPRGQTVRRLFSSSDAALFAAERAEPGQLLDLKPEIEGVLDQLEARLCD